MITSILIEKLNGHDKEGKIGKLYCKVGSPISIGDVLFTIESSKGALSVKSLWDGTILELSICEGDMVTKGQIVGNVDVKQAEATDIKKGYNFGLAKPMNKTVEVDVLIVGGGPGGYVAAIKGAMEGLSVALIEEDRLGGTCLNYGCIPTKALTSSVSLLEKIKSSELHGIDVGAITLNLDQMMARKNEIVHQLVGGIEHLLNVHAIEYINGTAKLNEQGQITVQTKQANYNFNYKNLILALGSKPSFLPIPGAELEDILTSQDLLDMKEIPKSLTIIGGGVIGMEFAFIFRALGSEVNVVEFLPQILNTLDSDIAETIRDSATEKGIKVFESTKAIGIKNTLDGSKLLEVEINGVMMSICSQSIVMAVGRKANLKSLALDKLGVNLNERNNGINVDGYMRTNVEHIYAIGDVTNKLYLAHVASHQGMVAIDHILGKDHEMDYRFIPSVIFTSPEVGCVGMNEKEAKNQNIEIISGKFPFVANGKAITMGEPEGFVKVIADANTRVIIGGSIVGVHASNLISVLTNLIVSETKIDDAAKVVYAHPTTSESIHEAILMLDKRAIHFA